MGWVSSVWAVVKPLRPHPLAVGQARNFCTRRLMSVLNEDDRYAEAVADAAMIASELVTNAVTAGSSAIELSMLLRPRTVLISVQDDAGGVVAPTVASGDDVSGRGLMIVAALAREWGVTPEDGSKQVWAEIELRHDCGGKPAAG